MMSSAAQRISEALTGGDNRNQQENAEFPYPPFTLQNEQQCPGSEKDMQPRPNFGENSYIGTGKLRGRVALITGGDSGIGRAVAVAFAREGADVAISYLNEHDDARETSLWVEKAGRRCILLPGDLQEEAQCRKIVEDTVAQYGRLDILVNNAAYQGRVVEKFEQIPRKQTIQCFMTNIVSMFTITQEALKHMKQGSCIINTSSIEAYQPDPYILDYACTKAAVMNFTKGLAKELISRGIRCNAVAPGPVWTPFIPQSFDKSKIAQFGKDYPMGRPAQPAELAPSYVFLAEDNARYINGEILSVTGGELTM